MADQRAFANEFDDYSNETEREAYLSSDGKLCDSWKAQVENEIVKLVHSFDKSVKMATNPRDYTVYTGSTGTAIHFYNLYKKLGREEWLKKAGEYVELALNSLRREGMSFLCGSAGVHAFASVYYSQVGRNREAQENYNKVLEMLPVVLGDDVMEDEILYGRSGYLYTLLFLKQHSPIDHDLDEPVEQVIEAIVLSGTKLSNRMALADCPLMYTWHDTIYLGAAHGLSGIFFMLMRAPTFNDQPNIKSLVERSIDYLITVKYPSGNYPSSLRDGGRDKLVHWCHGAPGFVHMFLMAYKIYGKDAYLAEAISCGEVIWSRGLLRKGYGLCHGVAGNGYAFLSLYQVTKDLRHLHRALKFAQFIFDYGTHGCRIADHPYSLFEGLAGTVYYLVDLLDPANAAFPCFY